MRAFAGEPTAPHSADSPPSHRAAGASAGELDIGLALLGFLRLFSPPNRGGLDLAQIGLDFKDNGSVFLHRKGGTPLVIVDPAMPENCLGGGSYALASVQAYFAEIAESK